MVLGVMRLTEVKWKTKEWISFTNPDCLVKDMKVKSLEGNLPVLPAIEESVLVDFSWSMPKR